MIGYLNKWVSSNRITKVIMLWTNLLHQGFLQMIAIYMNRTKRFYLTMFYLWLLQVSNLTLYEPLITTWKTKYLKQHSLTEKRSIATFFKREHVLLQHSVTKKTLLIIKPPLETINLSIHVSFTSHLSCLGS